MATVHQFAYGWINPVLAYAMSVLGVLLGILLARKARKRIGRARARLLVYASVAVGGIAIWQAHVVGMLGFDVPDSLVRFEPLPLAGGLLVAVLDVGVGLFIAGFGAVSWWRLVVAGVVMGVGAVTAQYMAMAALHVGGTITYEPRSFILSSMVGLAFAWGLLIGTVTLSGLRTTVPAATVLGAGLYAMHYSGLSGVRVHLGLSGVDGVTGLTAIALTPPVLLFGAAIIAMLAYFTLGTSTVRDLRRIYEPNSEQIEPWMIDIVVSRVASDPPRPQPASEPVRATAVPRHRPPALRAPGSQPPWRSVPTWGTFVDGPGPLTPPELRPTEYMPTEPLAPAPQGPPTPRPVLTRYPATVAHEIAEGRWRNRRRP